MAALGWLLNLGFAASPSGAVVVVAPVVSNGGGYLYPMDRPVRRKKFRADDEQEKKAKPILEDIAANIDPVYETSSDYELILRLRLREQGLIYKSLYLKWLKKAAQEKKAILEEIQKEEQTRLKKLKKRRDEEMILLALFH